MKRRRAYLAERQAENTPVDHALMVSIAGMRQVCVTLAKSSKFSKSAQNCVFFLTSHIGFNLFWNI